MAKKRQPLPSQAERTVGTAPADPKTARGMAGRAALGHAKPRTYEELRAVLSSGTVHFPKRLRQVAIYLWQHPSDVATLQALSGYLSEAGQGERAAETRRTLDTLLRE